MGFAAGRVAIRGAAVEGLLLEGLMLEGLMLEGLLLEGLLLEGLLLEGLGRRSYFAHCLSTLLLLVGWKSRFFDKRLVRFFLFDIGRGF